jgi:hypothetical protein
MSMQIVIKKNDKIVLSKFDGKHIADIMIAHSSRTSSVNLSIQADMNVKISKTKFGPARYRIKGVRPGRFKKMTIKELEPQIENAILKVQEIYDVMESVINPQSLECLHKLEGQLLALTAVHQAIKSNCVFLETLGEKPLE